MVKVINATIKEGDNPFVLLELQGDLELVQSQKTGKFYGTARTCKIPCTLDLQTAKSFIGIQIPGSIIRVETDPYEYTIEKTGEAIILMHRWEYVPEVSMRVERRNEVVGLSVA